MAKNFSKTKIAEHNDPIINDTITDNGIQFRKLRHKTRLSFLPQKKRETTTTTITTTVAKFFANYGIINAKHLKTKFLLQIPFCLY